MFSACRGYKNLQSGCLFIPSVPTQVVFPMTCPVMGTAYKEGFKDCTGGLIFSIDSDLSHDPKYLPMMIEHISKSDIVIGSRICEGGEILGRNIFWDFFHVPRQLYHTFLGQQGYPRLDKWSQALPKSNLGKKMPDVHCYKWDFQFESLYRSQKLGAVIKEIPITFHERAGGSSKFNSLDAVVFLRSFFRILLE